MRKLSQKEITDSGLHGYTRYWINEKGKIYGANDGDKQAHLLDGAYLTVIVDESRAKAMENAGMGKDYFDWLHS